MVFLGDTILIVVPEFFVARVFTARSTLGCRTHTFLVVGLLEGGGRSH